MKKKWPRATIIVLTIVDILVISFICLGTPSKWTTFNKEVTSYNKIVTREEVMKTVEEEKEEIKQEEAMNLNVEPAVEPSATLEPIITPTPEPAVYDGLNMQALSEKLERSLHSDLKGYGNLFATYSLELGIDPYLALAITLHETGCKWNCSTLVKKCNNVGGMKGSPGCNGGSYKAFASLEVGIKSYLDNLYNNYYKYGLTTPEAMNSKYAESTTWASQVNAYINDIRAK